MLPNTLFAARTVFLLIDVSLRALILVAVAGLACCLLRRSSAAARSLAWALTLAALLFLPLLRVLMPPLPAFALPAAAPQPQDRPGAEISALNDNRRPIAPPQQSQSAQHSPSRVPVPAASKPRVTNPDFSPIPARVTPPQRLSVSAVPTIIRISEHRTDEKPLLLRAAVLLWLAGVFAVLARTALGLVSAKLLVNRCRPVTAGRIAEQAVEARRAIGVAVPLRLVTGDLPGRVVVPMACGFARPVILLPADAGEWPAERLRVVLLHEMGHVRRGDWIVQALARCVCALYWFHPLVWLAAHRLRTEGERACDDLVLSCDVAPPDYAGHLLEIVHRLSRNGRAAVGAVGMARNSEVNERLQAILAERQNRGAMTQRRMALSALIAAAVTVPLASLHSDAAHRGVATPPGKSTPPLSAEPAGLTDVAAVPPLDFEAVGKAMLAAAPAGKITQGAFTLMDVTAVDPKKGVDAPRNLRVPPPQLSVPIIAWEGGLGLWIRVQGGVGFKTIDPVLDGQRRTYPFDGKTLTVSGKPGTYSWDWIGADGVSRVSYDQQPYTIWSGSTAGHPSMTLVPRQLSRQCRVTAQPLSASGRPLGSAVSLICQPVSSGVMFAELPDGYDSATKQMAVTASLVGSTMGGATWRLTKLPAPVAAEGSGLSAAAAAYGPCTLAAAAVESEDLSGDPPDSDAHPPRPAGGQWFYQQPLNADEHGWTGVPTIRLLMRAYNASSDFTNQNWMVRLDDMVPEWKTTMSAPASPAVKPFHVFPLSNVRSDAPAGSAWDQYDWQVGVAYPGQQRWVRVDGAMIRFDYHTETVTFHDAAVAQDGPLHVNRLVWSAPETETTPSGISVTVVNARPGAGDPQSGAAGSQYWRFEGADAPLVLAWKLPPGFVPAATAPEDAADEAAMPDLAPYPSAQGSDFVSNPSWSALAIPGQTDASALAQSGYQPFCLTVATATSSPSPEDEGDGVQFVPPPSSPRALKTVTLTIRVREQVETHPFHFLVPVNASFPQGWDPNAADGRSSSP